MEWHLVDDHALQTESAFPCEGLRIFRLGPACCVMAHYRQGLLHLLNSACADWAAPALQTWLRKAIRDAVILRAEEILPLRLHHWERQTGLRANSVTVNPRLKKNLGNCSSLGDIRLFPVIVLFPIPFMDEVILHEMAHLTHMHHRKSF